MACSNPRLITNRSRSFLLGIDKPTISVPCGKCEGCLQDKKNEWWIRARQEIIDCIDKGGRVFFPTFTYTERCLPKHYYRDGNGKLQYFPCFNHDDKNRYLNSFRKEFEREGLTKGFKYFWVSEYGEVSTCRPHYHALFFFDSTYSKYSDEVIIDRIKSHWAFGRVDANDELGMKVNPIYKDKASSYVSKYTTKDLSWYEQPLLKKFIEIKGMSALKSLSDKLPKKFCSKGFGKGLVDVVLDSKSPKDYFTKGVELFMSDGSTKNFNLPRYVYDKLMYRVDKETGFKEITEFGQDMLQKLFDEQVQESAKNLKMQSLAINMASKVSVEDIEHLIPIGYDKTHYSLSKLIEHTLNGRTFEQLAIYKKVFRNMTVLDDSDYIFLEDVFNNNQQFRRYASRIENMKKSVSIDDRNGQEWTSEPMLNSTTYIETLNQASYNNHKCFQGFDEVLNILDYIQRIASMKRLKVRIEQELKDREIKRQLKEQKAQIRTLSRTHQISKFY